MNPTILGLKRHTFLDRIGGTKHTSWYYFFEFIPSLAYKLCPIEEIVELLYQPHDIRPTRNTASTEVL